MSLSTELKTEIERWVGEVRETRLAALARDGALGAAAVAYYLGNLRYLFASSQANLHLAARRAAALGDRPLATYLARKAGEEEGHDQWAEDDLAKLPAAVVARDAGVGESVTALVALQRSLIEHHPICFVAYAQWAEYFTVLVGDEWLDGLARSGFAPPSVSAIAKHVEADRAHAEAGLAEIDGLYRGDPAIPVVLGGVTTAEQLFVAFSDEVSARAGSP